MMKILLIGSLTLTLLQQCGEKPAPGDDTSGTAGKSTSESVVVVNNDAASPVLVELFTSEGCSSCPPADQLLSELAQTPGVVALSFHVTYWDRLGWKDPYGAAAYTDRQQMYGKKFQLSSVYTPQMVVNGKTEFVGSDDKKAATAIKQAANEVLPAGIELEPQEESNSWSVNFKLTGNFMGKIFYMALVEDGLTSDVKRGENSGKKLRHDRVVRQLEYLPITHQRSGSLSLTMPEGAIKTNCHIVAWLQMPDGGPVLAISQTDL